jgi:hypothetical protein
MIKSWVTGLGELSVAVGTAIGKLLLDGIKALPGLATDMASAIGDLISNGVSNVGAVAGLAGRIGSAIGSLLLDGERPGCSWGDNPWIWALTFRRL